MAKQQKRPGDKVHSPSKDEDFQEKSSMSERATGGRGPPTRSIEEMGPLQILQDLYDEMANEVVQQVFQQGVSVSGSGNSQRSRNEESRDDLEGYLMELHRELTEKNRAFEERKSKAFDMINSLKIMEIRDAQNKVHRKVVSSYEEEASERKSREDYVEAEIESNREAQGVRKGRLPDELETQGIGAVAIIPRETKKGISCMVGSATEDRYEQFLHDDERTCSWEEIRSRYNKLIDGGSRKIITAEGSEEVFGKDNQK